MARQKERTTTARIRGAENRRKAIELRRSGKGYAEIGATIGCTPQHAHRLVKSAIHAIISVTAEETEELRQLELERLDIAQSRVWGQVLSGNLLAIDRLLKIMERRATYIPGLTAPKTFAETDTQGNDLEPARSRLRERLIAMAQRVETTNGHSAPFPG